MPWLGLAMQSMSLYSLALALRVVLGLISLECLVLLAMLYLIQTATRCRSKDPAYYVARVTKKLS